MTNRVQIYKGLLFYAYVGIQQGRIFVLDNNQTCSGVHFTTSYKTSPNLGLVLGDIENAWLVLTQDKASLL